MGNLTKVWIDSSHRSGDKKCQAGVVFNDHVKGGVVKFSSGVYMADNNNDSEILGIYFALRAIYEKYSIKDFRVFNDSVIACEMLRADKDISTGVYRKYPILQFVREYFDENEIYVRTEHTNRTDKVIKVCDRLSKRFRKEKKYE